MAEALVKSDKEDIHYEFGEGDDLDDEFETPPDSPDDVRISLTAEFEQEIADTQLAEEHIKKNQESIAKSLESVRELQTTMVKLISHAQSRTSELKNRSITLKTMKQEIDEISMEAIAHEEEELKKLIKTEAAELTNGDQQESNNNLETLKAKAESFKEELDFTIDLNSDWIEYKFTNPSHPEKPYTIKLKVEGDVYQCASSDPASDHIANLVSQFNQNHDLQDFLTRVKEVFETATYEN